jgi:signal transduction histidine kinase
VPNELGRVLQGYLTQQQQDLQLQQQQLQLLQREQEHLLNLLRDALDMSKEELRAALKSASANRRFVAAYAVGERRLFWQDDLNPLLKDDADKVRQATRRSLVILSFLKLNPDVASGTLANAASPAELTKPQDFGPLPGAKRAAREKAAQEWGDWWNDQGKAALKPLDVRKEAEPDALAARLVKATGERRKELLKEYIETSGTEYTLAIAHAIPSLSGDARKEAREALAERLSNRKEKTLRRYLEDDDPEIRRGAALALGMRDAKETVAEVAKLLLDPDPSVVRATHASLRSLTGEDYGPTPYATEEEKQEAVKKYQAWRARK